MSKLMHHGIKGQRWGVRRYQNEDGTLTAAGKQRIENKDSKSFAELASRYANTYADHMNSTSTTYFTDDKGKVMFRPDGTPRAMQIYDTNKYADWKRSEQNYLRQKELLQKKYSDVKSNIELTAKGKSYITVELTDKLGNKYISELETEYKNVDFERFTLKRMFS